MLDGSVADLDGKGKLIARRDTSAASGDTITKNQSTLELVYVVCCIGYTGIWCMVYGVA